MKNYKRAKEGEEITCKTLRYRILKFLLRGEN